MNSTNAQEIHKNLNRLSSETLGEMLTESEIKRIALEILLDRAAEEATGKTLKWITPHLAR